MPIAREQVGFGLSFKGVEKKGAEALGRGSGHSTGLSWWGAASLPESEQASSRARGPPCG